MSGMMSAKLLHCFEHFAHGYLANKENLQNNDYVVHIAWYAIQQLVLDIPKLL